MPALGPCEQPADDVVPGAAAPAFRFDVFDEGQALHRPHLGEFLDARRTKKNGRQLRPVAEVRDRPYGRWDAQGRASRGGRPELSHPCGKATERCAQRDQGCRSSTARWRLPSPYWPSSAKWSKSVRPRHVKRKRNRHSAYSWGRAIAPGSNVARTGRGVPQRHFHRPDEALPRRRQGDDLRVHRCS